ncbi:MAG: hypothetical protein LAO20_12940 [Acidobacteriia bacterium]|nr:hypothetical protein [Terriglobia bacterium]
MVSLEKIDTKIAKMEQLKTLLADPEMAQLARDVLSGANHPLQISDLVDIALGRPDSIIRKALEAVATFDGRFTAQDLKDRMLQSGYRFSAHNPMVGVQRVVRQLLSERIVERVEEGAGRRPHVYICVRRK